MFYDLMRGLEIRAYRRTAIWCLIDKGFLIPVSAGKINDRSYLRVAAHLSVAA